MVFGKPYHSHLHLWSGVTLFIQYRLDTRTRAREGVIIGHYYCDISLSLLWSVDFRQYTINNNNVVTVSV